MNIEPSPRLRIMCLGYDESIQKIISILQRFEAEVVIATERPVPSQSTHLINHSQSLDELIQQVQPDVIMSFHYHQVTKILVDIEQQGLLRVIPSTLALSKMTDRETLRRWVTEQLDLPTSRYAFAKSYNELQMQINLGIGYPCWVKPITFSLGQGHFLVTESEQVKPAWDYAIKFSESKAVIVEEQISLDYEVNFLVIRALGSSGKIETHFCEPIGYIQKLNYGFESWQPQRMTSTTLNAAQKIAQKVTERFGGFGVFNMSFFVKGARVWFNKVVPYPHQAGFVTMITQTQDQFELQARVLLGLPITTTRQEQGACVMIENHPIISESVETTLSAIPTLKLYGFDKPQTIQKAILASGQTIQEARQRVSLAFQQITTKLK